MIKKEDILDYLKYEEELRLRVDKVMQENIDKPYKELALLSKLEECRMNKEIDKDKLKRIKSVQTKDKESISVAIIITALFLASMLLIPILINSGHDKAIAYFIPSMSLLYSIISFGNTCYLIRLKRMIKKIRKNTKLV